MCGVEGRDLRHQDGCHLLFLGPTISVEDNSRGQRHSPHSTRKARASFPKCSWARRPIRPGPALLLGVPALLLGVPALFLGVPALLVDGCSHVGPLRSPGSGGVQAERELPEHTGGSN